MFEILGHLPYWFLQNTGLWTDICFIIMSLLRQETFIHCSLQLQTMYIVLTKWQKLFYKNKIIVARETSLYGVFKLTLYSSVNSERVGCKNVKLLYGVCNNDSVV